MVTKICVKDLQSVDGYCFDAGREYQISWNDLMGKVEMYLDEERLYYMGRLTLDEIRENFI